MHVSPGRREVRPLTALPGSARALLSGLLLAVFVAACDSGGTAKDFVASGKALLDKGQDAAAIIEFKNAVQQDASRADVRFLLGSALRRSGDLAAAEIELRKALSLGHDRNAVIPVLAAVLLEMGRTDQVLEVATLDGLTDNKAKGTVLALRADAGLPRGTADETQALYRDALAFDANNEAANLGMARLEASKGDLTRAHAILENVVKQHPDSLGVQLLRGSLHLHEGKVDAAIADYDRAMELRPMDTRAYAAAIPVFLSRKDVAGAEARLEKLRKVQPKAVLTYYMDALVFYAKGDRVHARESARQVVKAVPDDMRAALLAGNIEFDLGNNVLAEQLLTKVVAAKPDEVYPRRLLATTYLRLGRAERAKEVLAPALAGKSVDAQTLSTAAEIAMALKEHGRAVELLKKAVAATPGDAASRARLGQAQLRAGDVDQAVRDLQAATASDPTSFTADVTLISFYIGNKQNDRALAVARNLVKRLPDSPVSHNALGLSLLANGDRAGARESFDKALTLKPGFMPAVQSLAIMDIQDKKPEAARERFQAVLAKNPSDEVAALALAQLLDQQGAADTEVLKVLDAAIAATPVAARPRLAKIEYLARKGRLKDVLDTARQAQASLPEDSSVLLALARAQLAAKDATGALGSFGKLAQLMPGSPVPFLGQADAQILNKDWESAHASLQKAIDISPDAIAPRIGQVEVSAQAGRLQEARGEAVQIQKRWPKLPSGYLAEAKVLVLQKDLAQAEKVLRSGLDATSSEDIVTQLFGFLVSQGRRVDGDALLGKWIGAHPKAVNAMVGAGNVLIGKADHKAAEAWFRRAAEIQPDNPVILNNWAWVLGRLKDPKALEVAKRALSKAPRSAAVLDTTGWLYVQSGDTAKGIEMLQTAVKLAPEAASVRINLARALLTAGRKPEAKAELDGAAGVARNDATKKEIEDLRRGL